jgi:hypothetical protein
VAVLEESLFIFKKVYIFIFRPQFPRIERQLFDLFLVEENKGEHVSNKWIRETARILAIKENEKLLKEFGNVKNNFNQCQFSERWLNNFKKRFQIGNIVKEDENFVEKQLEDSDEIFG